MCLNCLEKRKQTKCYDSAGKGVVGHAAQRRKHDFRQNADSDFTADRPDSDLRSHKNFMIMILLQLLAATMIKIAMMIIKKTTLIIALISPMAIGRSCISSLGDLLHPANQPAN